MHFSIGQKMNGSYGCITTLRITCTRMNVELATNERRALKPRAAENWRGVSELMRGLYCYLLCIIYGIISYQKIVLNMQRDCFANFG